MNQNAMKANALVPDHPEHEEDLGDLHHRRDLQIDALTIYNWTLL
jgi:hypothetical protein